MSDSVGTGTGEDLERSRGSLSLILPAWNEAEGIGVALEEADAALTALGRPYEIIVVDDGSSDATAALVEEAARTRPRVRLVRHDVNRGYGAALRTGFAAAHGDLVAFTDADCQFHLRELDRLLLLACDYQAVVGYRIDRQDPWRRRFYSRVYNLLVGLLLRLGVRDVDCALKVFHRSALEQVELRGEGFLVNTELLSQLRQRGCTLFEIGVSHRPRIRGASKVSASHAPRVLRELLRYWWNQVQFPGPPARGDLAAAGLPQPARRSTAMGWLLWGVAAVLLGTNLGYPLIDRDETRYAEIPREMAATGNWLTPQLNFKLYPDKPPLLYWLTAAAHQTLGVSETSSRLTPVLSSLAALALTAWFGARMLGQPIGALGAVVLGTSFGFLAVSRMLLIDSLFTALTALTMFAAYEAVHRGRLHRGWWLASAAACGAAGLAKGPVALVLTVPPIAAYVWLTTSAATVRWRDWAAWGAVAAAVAAPWFIAIAVHQPAFAWDFVVLHNIRRFGGAFHSRPWWYFVPVLLVAGFPWTFVTIPCVRFLITSDEGARSRRPPALGFLAMWGGWCFLFFSASSCKLATYVLPATPALALMTAHFLHHARGFSLHRAWDVYVERWAPWIAAAAVCLAGAGFAAFGYAAGLEGATVSVLIAVFWLGLLTLTHALRVRGLAMATGWRVCVAWSLLLAAWVLHREVPQYARARTLFGPESPMVAEFPELRALPLATAAHEWSEAPFYLQRTDVQNFPRCDAPEFREFFADHAEALLVVYRQHDLDALRVHLPPGAEIAPLGERGDGRLVLVTRKDATRSWRQSQRESTTRR